MDQSSCRLTKQQTAPHPPGVKNNSPALMTFHFAQLCGLLCIFDTLCHDISPRLRLIAITALAIAASSGLV
jgi:hypothetical protein